ncbi:FecR domain-containing protein [Rhizobium sp. BK602]|uniref:FecR domain-containing protein n=1 Tax=Rhizobium sp. BK602 TaxID=2586986 RepID=UPI00161E2454|nr:FecR domain-containing protein [Rhizobium sp. BK602]MBB3607862.1 ferric-dicitrate binding protein FerR (iron transport regulator) [Rhizobium sp. BK602]
MTQTSGILGLALMVGILSVAAIDPVLAQAANCSRQPTVSDRRQTLDCEPGLSVTIERGAHYRFADRNRDGQLDAIVLNSKAALVDVEGGRIRGGFEVVTPQAIAAVRGTRWAVDAERGKTSVLVLRGRVAVNKVATGEGVTLGQGQGVDVDRGRSPLRVTQWGQPRINALMARLGQ